MSRLLGFVGENPISNLNVAAYDLGAGGVMLVAEHADSHCGQARLRIDHQEWELMPKGTGMALLGLLERLGVSP